MKTQLARSFFLSFVTAAILGVSLSANAKWTRTHAADCTTLGGAPLDTSFALFNSHPFQNMIALCAVSDTDRFAKENISTLNVHGFDGHTSLRAGAMACRSLWHATGGSCGSMAQSASFQENYTLKPNLSEWSASTRADFGYLWVRIPPVGAAMSSLRGYFTSGS